MSLPFCHAALAGKHPVSKKVLPAKAAPVALCPDQLEVKLPPPALLPPGWENVLPGPQRTLSKVQLYDGPPDATVELPAHRTPEGNWHWQFHAAQAHPASPNDPVTPPRPVWLKCLYGEPGLNLIRPLPRAYSSCQLRCDSACRLHCE